MQKAKVYNIADSNIANLGSDLEKKVKLNAAQHEEAWKNAGKAPGLDIWRVEQFKIHAVPKETHGQFFSGDSYIILRTYKKTPDSNALAYDAHFWLGTYTTQDEAGTAAYKTVELDDFLGGTPVQFREVQGHESNQFLSNFPNGIRLQEGGAESGFHHVKPEEYRPRLLHVKGNKKHVRLSEVPKETASLNSGDVFILDLGTELIQWNGSSAGPFEKNKAATILSAIESERDGRAKGRVIQDGDDDKTYWEHLGGKKPVKSAAEGGADAEASASGKVVLLRLSDESGKLEFTQVAEGTSKFPRSHLNSKDVLVLDNGEEVIVWVGKTSSKGERKNALSFAHEYITKHNKPEHTPIVRVLEGGEHAIFDAHFQ